jgi:hypothetical protein
VDAVMAHYPLNRNINIPRQQHQKCLLTPLMPPKQVVIPSMAPEVLVLKNANAPLE